MNLGFGLAYSEELAKQQLYQQMMNNLHQHNPYMTVAAQSPPSETHLTNYKLLLLED